MSKNIDTLKEEFKSKYKELVSTFSLNENSVEYDIFVDAPANVLIQPYNDLDYLFALFLITSDPNSIEEADMDTWAADYGEVRLGATYAIVTLYFYRDDPPDVDIPIPLGTRASTVGSNAIEFETTEEKIMYSSNPSIYYDPDTNKYGIAVLAQAVVAGEEGVIGSNLITKLSSAVTGITSVNNKVASTGGEDQETNTDLVSRVISGFKGRNAAVYDGLEYLMLSQTSVQDSLIIDATNPLMVRDAGRGRCVDIYIVGTVGASYTDNTTMTSTGIISLIKQPVHSISSVVGSVAYSSDVYSLVKDTGYVRKSPKANDYLLFSSTGTIPTLGESLTIKYTYNKLLHDLTDLLTIKENKVPNRDVLVREAFRVNITIKINLILNTGADPSTVQSAVQTVISAYILPKLQSKIEQADITTLAGKVSGVDNSEITELSGVDEEGNTITPDVRGDLILSEQQYPVLLVFEAPII